MLLKVSSVEISLVGIYFLVVKANVHAYASNQFNIKVTVTKLCDDMFITKYAPADIFFTLFQDPPLNSIFTPWTEDVGTCGPFTYTPRLTDGRPWPSFITFTEPLRKFEVYSNNFSHVGTYNIEIKG